MHEVRPQTDPDKSTQPCVIGSNAYIGPYTSVGGSSTILNTEIGNSIIMDGAYIDCGRRITDSLIGRKVRILNHEHNVPKGHKLILGDQSTATSFSPEYTASQNRDHLYNTNHPDGCGKWVWVKQRA